MIMAAVTQTLSSSELWPILAPTEDEPFIELPNGVVVERLLAPPGPTSNELGVVEFDQPIHRSQAPELIKKARLMYEAGLENKAKRQAACQQLGIRFKCSNTECGKQYYRGFSCRNRYCLNCGRRLFDELLGKHLRRLRPVVDRMALRRGFVFAKLDFTTLNRGVMPTGDEVKEFNGCIKRFMRSLEKKMGMKRGDYGLLYCDEFGGEHNTNLHAHGAYVGPLIPRQWFGKGKLLSEMWRQACEGTPFEGSFIVSMKAAKFEVAVAHALKYAGKFISQEPERLAALEVAFHGVRRVHSLGAFYNVKESRRDRDDAPCPCCGSALLRLSGYVPIAELIDAGFQDLDQGQKEARRKRGLVGPIRGAPWEK